MPARKKATRVTPAKAAAQESGPEVIVDFVFERGLFHLAVANVSDTAAFDVSVQFEPPFRGLGGEAEVSALPLFRDIPFLAPRKRIETFLDSSSAWFVRQEPTRITALIAFRDANRRAFRRRIVHDLGIYRDVSYVLQREVAGPPAAGASSEQPRPSIKEGRHGSDQR